MAHINFQGTPTGGRIGGVSYYISSLVGLIARIATNLVPKDRKSSKAQRVTQLAISNWVILWRKFAKRLEPTFNFRPKGESSYNAFVRANWERVRVYLTKEMVEAGACVIPPCEINHGDLTPEVVYWKDADENWMVSSLLLGDLVITADTTVGEFSRAVTTCNKEVFPEKGLAKANFIDFFCAQQLINIDTRFPMANIIGRSLRLDDDSKEKLWEVTGGSEGFQSFKGHLATPYRANDLYTWVRLSQDLNDEYHSTTQSLMGDNTALINRYTTEEAFLATCQSYGGFSQKFLTPYKAKCNTFNYSLRTFATVAGENPEERPSIDDEGESGSQVQKVQLTFAVNNSALGQVSPASGEFTVGSTVQATASVKSGVSAEFTGWADGVSSATRTITVPATPTTYTANFRTTGGGNQGGDQGGDSFDM